MRAGKTAPAERRPHPRWNVRLPISYRQVSGAAGALRHGVTLNVSRSGVRFRAEEFLPPGVFVAFEMILPRRSSYSARGRVVWVREARGDEYWDVGAEFLRSDPDADAALAEAMLFSA